MTSKRDETRPAQAGRPEGDPLAVWRVAAQRVLKGRDPATALVTRNRDGVEVGPLFAPADVSDSHARPVPDVPVGIFQRIDGGGADEAGRLALDDLEGGATGLTLVFTGASSARSFGIASDRTWLSECLAPVRDRDAVIRCEFPPLADAADVDRVLDVAQRLGQARWALELAADPLGEAARRGGWRSLPEASADPAALADASDLWLETLRARRSAGAPLRADGRVHHEAGASEAQELAAVLSTGVFYLRALDRAGLDRSTLRFTLAADADHDLTVAKFRALRRLWARVEQACGLDPQPIHLHAETAWRMLARRDPWSNILRGTLACAAAIVGGSDSVTVLPFTSALGMPDGFARRVARNTPLILLEEARLAHVSDPGAGSGLFEAVTAGLCRAAWAQFQTLEAEGGLAASLAAGHWQARLAATREARTADIAAGALTLVGVTAYTLPNETLPAVLATAPPEAGLEGEAPRTAFPPLAALRDPEPFEDGGTQAAEPEVTA